MMDKHVIRIGLIGLGTVGSGVLALLRRNGELIRRRAGCSLEIHRIAVRDLNKPRDIEVDRGLLTSDARELTNDPEIDVIVEVMGGIEPARTFLLASIAGGKSVVTANKELLAKHGAEILDAAKAKGVDVNFEGSVAGGIPLIAPLKQSLVANRILRVMGILNGTTNYILTRMSRSGADFATALKEAQERGFAESDPSSDIDGHDAAYKIAIVGAIAFSSRLPVEEVYREGISRIDPKDIQYASELKHTIKLLAIAQAHDDPNGGNEDSIELRVHPTLIPNEHPLASVNDEFNAILVEGDAVGRVMFYGRGAGAEPTGSAVVGDIVDAARNLIHGAKGRIQCTCDHASRMKSYVDLRSRFYLRMLVADKPGVLAHIAGILGEEQVSIASMIQQGEMEDYAELVWITHDARQQAVDRAVQRIRELDVVKEIGNVIHVIS